MKKKIQSRQYVSKKIDLNRKENRKYFKILLKNEEQKPLETEFWGWFWFLVSVFRL